jgi:SAM-dependent methyltransferase
MFHPHRGATMSEDPYADPVLYDLEYANYTRDIDWYRALVAGVGGPILELGVGSGRMALPLLEDGHELVGVDRSQPMLDAFARRLARAPSLAERCELHCGDFRDLSLGRRFPTVLLPFNALHHCADDDELDQLLATVRRHLAPRGVFGLDCYLPDPELYHRDPEERYEPRVFLRPDNGETLTSWEQSWFDIAHSVHHVRYTYQRADGTEHQVALDLRMWRREDLHTRLAAAGLHIVHEMADFDGLAMTEDATRTVLVLTH